MLLPLIAALLLPLPVQDSRTFDVAESADGTRFVRGELIVALEDTAAESAVEALGGRVLERVPALGLVRVALRPGEDALVRKTAFAAQPGVRYAELNQVGEGGGFPPDDTWFFEQWHLNSPFDADINALEAWSIQTGDPGVVVAVLDSGIDFAHPEFLGRLLPGYDFVDEDDDPTADHSHGIRVTGLLAANADNAFGVAGVDHHCTVLPVKILNSGNFGSSFDLVQGIDYARQQNVEIVSMSLINFGGSQSLRDALAAARAAGLILISCSGNLGFGNAEVSWPGASEHTIAIGWTNAIDVLSWSSGTGAALDFVAPGSSVVTTSSSHADTRAFFSGCSAATPVAAGVVSLLVAQDPTLDQDRIYELLRLSAADKSVPGRDDFYGHGRLDVLAALDCLASCAGRTYCDVSPNSYSSGARISARGSEVVADDDLTLHVDFAPPGAFGLFYFGQDQTQEPFGAGLRCVGGMSMRLNPPNPVDGTGSAMRALSLSGIGFLPGTSSNFQYWFRDITGPSNFNLSDGVHVDWK